MKKNELNLQTLINLKPTLERLVENGLKTIITNNAVLKDQRGKKIDTAKEYEDLKLAFKQLQAVKLGMFLGNKKKNSFGVINQETIFEKSDLEREYSLLSTLSTQKLHRRQGEVEDAYDFIIPKSEIEDRLLEIEKRISEIKQEMSRFNQSTTVKIDWYDSLQLL